MFQKEKVKAKNDSRTHLLRETLSNPQTQFTLAAVALIFIFILFLFGRALGVFSTDSWEKQTVCYESGIPAGNVYMLPKKLHEKDSSIGGFMTKVDSLINLKDDPLFVTVSPYACLFHSSIWLLVNTDLDGREVTGWLKVSSASSDTMSSIFDMGTGSYVSIPIYRSAEESWAHAVVTGESFPRCAPRLLYSQFKKIGEPLFHSQMMTRDVTQWVTLHIAPDRDSEARIDLNTGDTVLMLQFPHEGFRFACDRENSAWWSVMANYGESEGQQPGWLPEYVLLDQ